MSALIGAAVFAPDSRLVEHLRGRGGLEMELQSADTQGYYESLLELGGKESKTADADADVIRPASWKPFDDSGIVEFQANYLRRRMKPNLHATWNGESFTTNSRGYRTPEVAIPKPSGTFRIVVIGSSNTMGHGVGDDAPYPRLLERWLNHAPGVDAGRPVEVVNLAISGDSPSQQLLRMQEDVAQYDPDWILTDASVLDFSLEEAQIRWVLKHQTPIPLGYVREAVGRLSAASGGSTEELNRKFPQELEALLGGAYAGWAAESRRLKVPMTVVLLPRADKAAESPHLVALVHRLCARNGLHLIDISTCFSGLSVDEFRVSDVDAHPSVLGHQRIFGALSKQLLREGFPAVIRGGGGSPVTAAP
jgi:lysophospholipase L1-like esterase